MIVEIAESKEQEQKMELFMKSRQANRERVRALQVVHCLRLTIGG